jgi:hypothetical protein
MAGPAVARVYTSVLEAQLAKSVLDAAGVPARLADEHLVTMNWTYSNAVGGVKILVPEEQLEEARALLDTDAAVEAIASAGPADAPPAAGDVCRHCGSDRFDSRIPRLNLLGWFVFGFPVGWSRRARYCHDCGAAAEPDQSPAGPA